MAASLQAACAFEQDTNRSRKTACDELAEAE
jgi:hypothetical protein